MTAPLDVAPLVQSQPEDRADPLTLKPMSADDVQSRMQLLLQACRTYDDELRGPRDKATKYFLGKPFGNEEDGRSKVVMTVLRDTVFSMYPALFRLFFNATERTVEFTPRNPMKVAQAEQQTELVNHIFLRENNGLLLTNAVLEDAMVRRLGIAKWWYEDATRTETTRYTDLTQDELELLAGEDSVELTGATATPGTGLDGQAASVWAVEAKRTIHEGKIHIAAVPREEFWYNRRARDKDSAIICAHATYLSVSALRKMGVPDSLLREATSSSVERTEQERTIHDPNGLGGADAAQMYENQTILYVEGYPNMDVDGDGIAELRKICTIGEAFLVTTNEPALERPFALLSPYPLGHRMEGLSVADLVDDLQLLESSVARGVLDSLSLSLFPRMEVVEGQVEMKDVLNTEIGGIIRAKQPGMVREVTHRFVGLDAMPMFDWIDGKKEDRTGRARGPDGLDQGAMQSSTPQAVQAAVSASQDRLELLARVAAETFFKPLFLGVYRLLKAHPQQAKMLRMSGVWTAVDPADWDDEQPDVLVNVALGNGLVERKLEVLSGIKQSQEGYIQQFGPENPLCGIENLRYTIERALKLSGEPDVDRYFKKIDPNNPPQLPPPAPDPQAALAQATVANEQQKTQIQGAREQATAARDQQQMEFDMQEAQAKHVLEQAKLAIAAERVKRTLDLREQQLTMQHEREVAKMQLDATLRREEMQLRAVTAAHTAEKSAETGVAVAAIGHDAANMGAAHSLAETMLTVDQKREATDAQAADTQDTGD